MEFVGGSEYTQIRNRKNLLGKIIHPSEHTHDGRYVVRLRKMWVKNELWVTVPLRFISEREARLYVMRNWRMVLNNRCYYRSGLQARV